MTAQDLVAKAAALLAEAAALGHRSATRALAVLLEMPSVPAPATTPEAEEDGADVLSPGAIRMRRLRLKKRAQASPRPSPRDACDVTRDALSDAGDANRDAAGDALPRAPSDLSSLGSDPSDPEEEADNTGDLSGSEDPDPVEDQKGAFTLEPSPRDAGDASGDVTRDAGGDAPRDARRDAKQRVAVAAVFDHWVRVMDKPRAQLTKDRRTKILARLREGYSVADLKAAVDGCTRSEFHMDNGHSDLATILKSGSTVEGHRDRPKTPPRPKAPAYQHPAAPQVVGDAYRPPEPL